jgi:hypothetical protein
MSWEGHLGRSSLQNSTSFPGLQCEDEARHEEALVWAGHVSTQKMAVFDSYSSRSGEIFFNEICKSSKQINIAKRLLNRYYLCVAKFGTNQLKFLKTPSICFLRYTVIFRQYGVSQSEWKIDRPRPRLPRVSPRPHTEALGTRLSRTIIVKICMYLLSRRKFFNYWHARKI